MLTEETRKKMKLMRGKLDQQTSELMEFMCDEISSIMASIDEDIQRKHIGVFQELVITQTLLTVQEVLIDAIQDGEFEKENEDGVAEAIDVITDCLKVQAMDMVIADLAAKKADQEFLDELEEDE